MHTAQISKTEPLPPRPEQTPPPSGWWPDSIEDILEVWALKEMGEWFDLCAAWHQGGGGAAGRPKQRAWGEDAVKPEARGRMWDLRGGKGNIKLWSNETEPVRSCIDRDKAAAFLAGCGDNELLSMLSTGVDFKCDSLPYHIQCL